jgi:hypothetical protein
MKPIQTLKNSFLTFSSGQNCLLIFKVKNVFFRLASLTVVKRVAHPTNGGLGKTPIIGREIAQVVETFMGRWLSKREFFYTKVLK